MGYSLGASPEPVLHRPGLSVRMPTQLRLRRTRLEPIVQAQEESDESKVRRVIYECRYLGNLVKGVALPAIECAGFDRVLHLGCRCGEWAMSIARECPSTWVVGIDKSRSSINHAGKLALHEGLANIEFLARDIDAAVLAGYEKRPFNLIYVSFVAGDVHPAVLPALFRTLVEHCVPGGSILWAEMELPLTNNEVVERFHRLLIQAMQIVGRAFDTGRYLGVTPLMRSWLMHAGCRIKDDCASVIDISRGSPARDEYVYHLENLGKLARPHVIATGLVSGQAYDRMFEQALGDMISLTFCGVCYVRVIHAVRDPSVDYGALAMY